jgi:hypothetical protein
MLKFRDQRLNGAVVKVKLGVHKGKFRAFCLNVVVLKSKPRVLKCNFRVLGLKVETLKLSDGDWKAIALSSPQMRSPLENFSSLLSPVDD